jgi:mannose-6-phosphate isomerase-like protein (cupin superfamily)
MYETQLQMTKERGFLFPAKQLTAEAATKLYAEFIHTSTLSSGIYTLKAGAQDPQSPHTEDELYYVMEGNASMVVQDSHFHVGPGDVIFVPAFVEHRFYDINTDLKLLVFFSKATAHSN